MQEINRIEQAEDANNIELNQQTAYAGEIGERRESFCIDYIRQKQAVFKEIQTEAVTLAKVDGKALSCRKGCSFCCSLYVEATIKECEAIVYHLYQNDHLLSLFLRNYPEWREKLKQNGDLFQKCRQVLNEARDVTHDSGSNKEIAELLLSYKIQDVSCPFLHNHECSIYEVRPYTCAAHYVATPPERCSSASPPPPDVYKAMLPEEIYDLNFYYRELREPGPSFMAITVYEILKGGYPYLSKLTGLDNLAADAQKL